MILHNESDFSEDNKSNFLDIFDNKTRQDCEFLIKNY